MLRNLLMLVAVCALSTSCEADVLPRAKICLYGTSMKAAANAMRPLLARKQFSEILDSSEHANIRDIQPRFIHWRSSEGLNVSLDEYKEESYVQVNVYEENVRFSQDAIHLYSELGGLLAEEFNRESIHLLESPLEANRRIDNSINSETSCLPRPEKK